MAFGCNIMGVFRQLKMEKEFLDNAKPTLHLEVFNDDLESIMMFENKSQEAAYVILAILNIAYRPAMPGL